MPDLTKKDLIELLNLGLHVMDALVEELDDIEINIGTAFKMSRFRDDARDAIQQARKVNKSHE